LKVLERRGAKCGRKVEKWAGKRKEKKGLAEGGSHRGTEKKERPGRIGAARVRCEVVPAKVLKTRLERTAQPVYATCSNDKSVQHLELRFFGHPLRMPSE
jgi:hypothetical protein